MNKIISFDILAADNTTLRRDNLHKTAACLVMALALIVGAVVLLDVVRINRTIGSELATQRLTVTSLRGELAETKADNIELRDTMRRCVTITNVITRMDFGNIKGSK